VTEREIGEEERVYTVSGKGCTKGKGLAAFRKLDQEEG